MSDGSATEGISASDSLIDDLVSANHILYDQGVVDGFGHVSARHDRRPDRFLMSRNMAPTSVCHRDILEFDLNSEPVRTDGPRVYLERFIHGEIYRAYPDVHAVVHSHSPSVVPLTALPDLSLRPIYHMAGFIGERAPLFDVKDLMGDGSDLMIRNRELGAAHARCFVQGPVVLLRGHGSTVVGESLQQAVFRAVYAEQNAKFQLSAAAIGKVIYLSASEAKACSETNNGQIARPWDLWKAESKLARPALFGL